MDTELKESQGKKKTSSEQPVSGLKNEHRTIQTQNRSDNSYIMKFGQTYCWNIQMLYFNILLHYILSMYSFLSSVQLMLKF